MNYLNVRQKHSLSINMGQCVLRNRVNICKEGRIHKPLLKYPIISKLEGQQKHVLFISKHVHSCFLQHLIKEKSPTNKKWMKQIIFLEGATKFISSSLQETGSSLVYIYISNQIADSLCLLNLPNLTTAFLTDFSLLSIIIWTIRSIISSNSRVILNNLIQFSIRRG